MNQYLVKMLNEDGAVVYQLIKADNSYKALEKWEQSNSKNCSFITYRQLNQDGSSLQCIMSGLF